MDSQDLRVRNILISQPAPESKKSPYYDIASKFNVEVDFRSFIQIEGINATEFRKQKINPADFSVILLSSKIAIDHFFRITEEMRIQMSQDTKYFCLTEAIALYLQKYIQYRKRKIFYGTGKIESLKSIFEKHKQDNILFPCSDVRKSDIPDYIQSLGVNYSDAFLYRTVNSDLSDLKNLKYDIIVFFTPSGIRSLYDNFPDFEQRNTRIAAFGAATKEAVKNANLKLDIAAPIPGIPSMTKALEEYIKKVNQ
jgi:uroporphyrinogen-III synthase